MRRINPLSGPASAHYRCAVHRRLCAKCGRAFPRHQTVQPHTPHQLRELPCLSKCGRHCLPPTRPSEVGLRASEHLLRAGLSPEEQEAVRRWLWYITVRCMRSTYLHSDDLCASIGAESTPTDSPSARLSWDKLASRGTNTQKEMVRQKKSTRIAAASFILLLAMSQ